MIFEFDSQKYSHFGFKLVILISVSNNLDANYLRKYSFYICIYLLK